MSIFIKALCKIFRTIYQSSEFCYYRFFYFKRKIETDLTQKRYLINGGESLDDLTNVYRELFLERVEAKISEADLICEHVFELPHLFLIVAALFIGNGILFGFPSGNGDPFACFAIY